VKKFRAVSPVVRWAIVASERAHPKFSPVVPVVFRQVQRAWAASSNVRTSAGAARPSGCARRSRSHTPIVPDSPASEQDADGGPGHDGLQPIPLRHAGGQSCVSLLVTATSRSRAAILSAIRE
jgi:hypothetical protein